MPYHNAGDSSPCSDSSDTDSELLQDQAISGLNINPDKLTAMLRDKFGFGSYEIVVGRLHSFPSQGYQGSVVKCLSLTWDRCCGTCTISGRQNVSRKGRYFSADDGEVVREESVQGIYFLWAEVRVNTLGYVP